MKISFNNFILFIKDAKRTEEHNVVVLVDFAIALMQTLDTINRESFQRFRLRMGLNHGPVIAGVIGKFICHLVEIGKVVNLSFPQVPKNLNTIFGQTLVSYSKKKVSVFKFYSQMTCSVNHKT